MALGLGFLATLPLLDVVHSQPQLPHAFYGTVTIGGAPAPAGTVVTATVDGVEVGRVELARPGIMGDFESQCSQFLCLLVQSAISGGSTIRFFLNGVEALQTAPFDSGELTELNLTDTLPEPAPTPTPIPSVTQLGLIAMAALIAALFQRQVRQTLVLGTESNLTG